MADPTILRANERRKAWATNLSRLGSGAIAYVPADIYLSQTPATWWLLVPLAGGVGMGWVAWQFLGLLESEK